MKDLFLTFKDLQALNENDSVKEDIYTVESIPDLAKHKIGVSKKGLPLFFIATNDSSDTVVLPIELTLIEVAFHEHCKLLIDKEGSKIEGIYTIVYLRNTESEDIIKYFIHTVHYLITQPWSYSIICSNQI